MANQLWVQDSFSKGELSPYMYGRGSVQQYEEGLRTALNTISYPTGAIGKRFGTYYRASCPNITTYNEVYFQTFHYLNECVYQLIFRPQNIDIYLEGILSFTVTSTGLDAQSCWTLDSTILNNLFRVSGSGFRPKDLKRSSSLSTTISAVNTSTNVFTLATGSLGSSIVIIAVKFTIAVPVTNPQIKIGVTYFIRGVGNGFTLYHSAEDAANQINVIKPVSVVMSAVINVFNNWTFTDVVFKNRPVYDFNGGYDSSKFTPTVVSGTSGTLTATGTPFTSAMVGGAYIGGGGVARITNYVDSSNVDIEIQQAFTTPGSPIAGSLSLLAEPAWSDVRGWPTKCSSYQNRAIFANSESLENGIWLSTINDYSNFNDLESDDDDAISWYPSSDQVNFIKWIVPYRSITVHTNSGVYSTPLAFDSAITPSNFSLQLQDGTPSAVLHPRAIDNQIMVVSGNDVYSLVWSGLNNAYTSSLSSIMNEQLIRDPVDEAVYYDFRRAGSRYVFIVNNAGGIAIFQTLLSEGVSGFTPAVSEQSYGKARFLQVASDFEGRCWFLTEREILNAGPTSYNAILLNTSTVVTFNANALAVGEIGICKITVTTTLPTTTPQLNTTNWYWIRGIANNQLSFYTSQEDALNDTDRIIFSNIGESWGINYFNLVTKFFIEELSFDTFLDCSVTYSGPPTSTVQILGETTIFDGMNIKMVGDGFGFDSIPSGGNVVFEEHGYPRPISNATMGFPINTIIEPMPLTIALGRSMNYLTRPKHIRNINFMFNNTIGGTINDVPIALKKFDHAEIGQPPEPQRGIFEMSIMKGWEDFNNPTFTIEHNDPFNIELLGIFYDLDV